MVRAHLTPPVKTVRYSQVSGGFFDSMSTVGVEVGTMEDVSSEVMKVSEAKGSTFEGFGGVVDALGEAVGEGTIEGVEDIHLPVSEHSEAA